MAEGLYFCSWNMQLEHLKRWLKIGRHQCHIKVEIKSMEDCKISEEKAEVLMDAEKSGGKS